MGVVLIAREIILDHEDNVILRDPASSQDLVSLTIRTCAVRIHRRPMSFITKRLIKGKNFFLSNLRLTDV